MEPIIAFLLFMESKHVEFCFLLLLFFFFFFDKIGGDKKGKILQGNRMTTARI
jgi:hypothetical protein